MPANSADIRTVIADNNQRWNDAFNSGNADAVAALYTQDATVLPHTHDVITGAEYIRSFWRSVLDAGFRDHTIEIIDVCVKGDLAYETARWTATSPMKRRVGRPPGPVRAEANSRSGEASSTSSSGRTMGAGRRACTCGTERQHER